MMLGCAFVYFVLSKSRFANMIWWEEKLDIKKRRSAIILRGTLNCVGSYGVNSKFNFVVLNSARCWSRIARTHVGHLYSYIYVFVRTHARVYTFVCKLNWPSPFSTTLCPRPTPKLDGGSNRKRKGRNCVCVKDFRLPCITS